MSDNLSTRDAHALDEFHQDLINAVNAADHGVAFTASLLMAYLDVAHQLDPGTFERYTDMVMLFLRRRFPESWEAKVNTVRIIWESTVKANLNHN